MKTLVIIPTLNESQNISKLLVKLSRLYKNIDILVVDDNSTDGTYDIVLKLASKLKNIKIISRKKDIGIGSAHLRGISYAYKKIPYLYYNGCRWDARSKKLDIC